MLMKLLETTLTTLCAIVERFDTSVFSRTCPHFLKCHSPFCPQPKLALPSSQILIHELSIKN